MPRGHFLRTDEHRRNISLALKGKAKSPEHCQAIVEAKAGCTQNLTKEQRKERSDRARRIHTGKVTSEATKKLLSDVKTGRSPLLQKYGISVDDYQAQIAAGNRWCSYGKHFLPDAHFNRQEGFCRDCKPAVYRSALLRLKYGVDVAWYDAKLAEQGGKCAICHVTKNNRLKHFMLDHSHSHGHNRGLLCGPCNFALSRVEAVPGWGEKALAYLAQYAPQSVAVQIPAGFLHVRGCPCDACEKNGNTTR